ncbi:hypothetical protein THAOC_35260, partial [Thalassiosira oceanica]
MQSNAKPHLFAESSILVEGLVGVGWAYDPGKGPPAQCGGNSNHPFEDNVKSTWQTSKTGKKRPTARAPQPPHPSGSPVEVFPAEPRGKHESTHRTGVAVCPWCALSTSSNCAITDFPQKRPQHAPGSRKSTRQTGQAMCPRPAPPMACPQDAPKNENSGQRQLAGVGSAVSSFGRVWCSPLAVPKTKEQLNE